MARALTRGSYRTVYVRPVCVCAVSALAARECRAADRAANRAPEPARAQQRKCAPGRRRGPGAPGAVGRRPPEGPSPYLGKTASMLRPWTKK